MTKGYDIQDQIFLAIDCIIFGFDGNDLKVLLIKRDFDAEKGKWSLIGGFLKNDEDLDSAAIRILYKLTGVHDIFMEQFYTYSEVDRDPVARTVSISYYALINIEDHSEELIQGYGAQWFSVSDAPKLIFDHDKMLAKAIKRLRWKAAINPLGFELLPKKFTMLQLQKLYEAIFSRPLDKRNFINKINSMDILIKLDEKDMSSSKKGSFLYMFDKKKYEERMSLNFNLGIRAVG